MLAEARSVTEPEDPIAVLIDRGDYREATSLCAREHGAALGRFCMALMRAQADAEEVVQETLLAAHRSMAGFRGEGTVKAWLYGIARRQCARHVERRTKYTRHLRVVAEDVASDAANPTDAPDASSPEATMTQKRRAQRLGTAIVKLKPSERDVVLLRFHAGFSFRQIGEICGVQEATARKRASRGLQRLRTLLDPEEMQ